MPKEIILYNLNDSVTDEQYAEYCKNTKEPVFTSLPSCKGLTIVKATGSMSGKIPYKYTGIVDITNISDWQKDAGSSAAFQDFLKEWGGMVSEFHVLFGEEIVGS